MKFEVEISEKDFLELKGFIKALQTELPSAYPTNFETPKEVIRELFYLDAAIAWEPTVEIIDLRDKVKVSQVVEK